MCLDMKDHVLTTPRSNPEYVKLKIKQMPDDIRSRYGIDDLATDNGNVYVKIQK